MLLPWAPYHDLKSKDGFLSAGAYQEMRSEGCAEIKTRGSSHAPPKMGVCFYFHYNKQAKVFEMSKRRRSATGANSESEDLTSD